MRHLAHSGTTQVLIVGDGMSDFESIGLPMRPSASTEGLNERPFR